VPRAAHSESGDDVRLHPNLRLLSCRLASDVEVGGAIVRRGADVTFDREGWLREIATLDAHTIAGVTCPPGSAFSFPARGSPPVCDLSRSSLL
jgi:hypothetical protein